MTTKPAGASPVDRGVRPHAIRLASQLQTAAYSHGYEDGHPANAVTRQAKYSDQAQRLRVALCEEIERLIAERDAARAELAKFTPLTAAQMHEAARSAQIAYCLDKHASYDVALIREVERLHGLGA